MAIGAFDDGVFTTHGSGIMIGPGIAVTAKHVIDEVLEQGGAGGLFAISCGTDRNIEIWGLLSYVRKAEFDLAIVTAQPQSEVSPFREMILPTITARVPDVGERVTAVGFRNTTLENTSSSSMIMLWSSGLVSANYPIGRDSVMLPGPSFEMDLPIVGGMSGGPVFDCHGNLIAVISTSLSSAEMKPSFAFLAWPLAALEIQPTWPRNMYPDVRAIKDLAPMVEVVNGQNVRKWADGDLEKFELSL